VKGLRPYKTPREEGNSETFEWTRREEINPADDAVV